MLNSLCTTLFFFAQINANEFYYISPNEIPDELPGENIILLVSSVREKKTCHLQDVRKGRLCYVYLISSPFRLQKKIH